MIEHRDKFASLLISSLIIHTISAATHSFSIRDGETLVSSGGMFALGFFSLGSSTNRYLGIYYNNIKPNTYVWVANREAPLPTKSGSLTVTESGILLLRNETNGTVWSSSSSSSSTTRKVHNPSVELLESGNLVVKDVDNDVPDTAFLWQSFDHPTDTYLPGMISLGWDLDTHVETYLSSWRAHDDPGPGEFTAHLDPTGYPQIVVRRGKTVKFRLGPWNGVRFSGSPGTRNNPTLRMNRDEVKYGEDNVEKSVIARLTLSLDGVGVRWIWSDESKTWMTHNLEADACDTYNACGAYGVCTAGDSPMCRCMHRFVHRDEGNLSVGCVARTALVCQGDVFLKYSGIKLPDARNTTYDERKMLPADCEAECLKKCSCTAYKQLDIREETSGCLFYYGELLDVRTMPVGGDELYIRIASADLGKDAHPKRVKLVVSLASMVAAAVLICLGLIYLCVWKRKKDANPYNEGMNIVINSLGRENKKNYHFAGKFSGSLGHDADLPFFNLSLILKATDNFSTDNKLGEGGFGPVYKGVLENGQEIAVKRLSKTSKQGVDELKNEVILIAKLQHRNLVRTLGCCAEGEESMLIYEYMPNNSLDFILFGKPFLVN